MDSLALLPCYLGADPEVALRDKSMMMRSAIPIIKASKRTPRTFDCCKIHYDNVAAEFSISPALTATGFEWNLCQAVKTVSAIIPSEYELLFCASAKYSPEELNCPEAQTFGCEPDFDAWSLTVNPSPKRTDAAKEGIRSFGGHIHIGRLNRQGDKLAEVLKDPLGKVRVVKWMDAIPAMLATSVSCVLWGHEEVQRRKLYGKAGAHRPKSYGVEYRALSGWWVGNPKRIHMITEATTDAVNAAAECEVEDVLKAEEIVNTVNRCDESAAHDIIAQLHGLGWVSDSTMEAYEECGREEMGE